MDVTGLPRPPDYFLEKLHRLHTAIRQQIMARVSQANLETLSAVASDASGDTLFAIDTDSEEVLTTFCRQWADELPLALVAEGLSHDGPTVLPPGTALEQAAFWLIVDPIDGTRGLMYDKRSAWILAAVAPNRGPGTSLRDIVLAYQTEIPTTRQYRGDRVWAWAGAGARGESEDLLRGGVRPLEIRPSRSTTFEHGFAMLSNFFPGGKVLTSRIEEELIRAVVGEVRPGKAIVYTDQYISTGGQLYELMMGHDRFNADLRSLVNAARGEAIGLCVRPYDICTELIARQAGCVIVDPHGRPLEAPLDTRTNLSWVGYANRALADRVHPLLMDILRREHLF